MSTGPLNSNTPANPYRGTAPLDPAFLAPPPPPPPPKSTGDLNQTSGSRPLPALGAPHSGLLAKQDELAQAKLELAQKHMALKEHKTHKSLWDRFTSEVGGLLGNLKKDVVGLEGKVAKLEAEVAHLAEAGGAAIVAGASTTASELKDGKGLAKSFEDGTAAAGKTFAKDVVDPYLEHTLGKNDKFADADTSGTIGPVLTNRLSIGESASIKVTAGGTFPLQEFGIPNAKIDAGATLTIKRVAKLDADGQPLTEPLDAKGNPPSELQVIMTMEGKAGGSYSTRVGVDSGAQVGDYKAGLQAGAGAQAEAGVEGKVSFTFSFDPASKQDMQALTGMVKATAATGAASAIPGLGPVLGTAEAAHHAKDFESFGRHLESIEGEGGLYAQASANAGVQAGIFKSPPKPAAPAADAPPSDPPKPDGLGQQVAGNVKNQAEMGALKKMQLQVAQLSGSAGGDVSIGGKVNFKTGETTIFAHAHGAANAGGSVLGDGTRDQVDADRKLSLTFAKDGHLEKARIEEDMTRSKFDGLQTTVEDIYGRPLQPGVLAGVSRSDTIRLQFELKPSELQRYDQMLHGSPSDQANALLKLGKVAIDKDTVQLQPGDIIAEHHDTFTIGGALQLNLGAQVGVRASISLDHGQETMLN
jgi:hypothetical protein